MKFKSQHKEFKREGAPKTEPKHIAHRDGKSIWITSTKGEGILMSREMATVRAAKAWMNIPVFNP